jgi:hypothetical protein
MKKVLFAVAVVALLGMAAQAGELKYYSWPTGGFIPQEITTIPVVMDIGYWVRIKDQDKLQIKLTQKNVHEYEGCCDMVVECNMNVTLSASVAKTAAAGSGKFSISKLDPANINSPGGTSTVCVKLTEADLGAAPGGSKNVHVATVTIKVVPQS